MRILSSPSALLVVAAFTACDTSYGVIRTAAVAFVPPPAEVETLVRSIPGVQAVEYQVVQGSRPLTLHGIQAPTLAHTFFYRVGAGVEGVLQFTEDYRHRVEYRQNDTRMGSPPPQREVDVILPVMREIEARLETQAGLAGLRRSVVQQCIGVKCS